MNYLWCLWPVSNDLKHTEASFSAILTDPFAYESLRYLDRPNWRFSCCHHQQQQIYMYKPIALTLAHVCRVINMVKGCLKFTTKQYPCVSHSPSPHTGQSTCPPTIMMIYVVCAFGCQVSNPQRLVWAKALGYYTGVELTKNSLHWIFVFTSSFGIQIVFKSNSMHLNYNNSKELT